MKRGGREPGDARHEATAVRAEVRRMWQEHERFEKSLGDEQRDGLRERLRSLERARQETESCLDRLDRDLAGDSPADRQIASRAREIHQAIEAWRREHRLMRKEMGA